jgi:hypothetical protein
MRVEYRYRELRIIVEGGICVLVIRLIQDTEVRSLTVVLQAFYWYSSS